MTFSLHRLGWLSLLTIGFLACDRIGQDVAPTDANTDNTELFALPDNKVAIDLTTLGSLQTATTFRIVRQPQSGTLTFASSGLLLYEPKAAFVAGDDDFSISATQQSGPVAMDISIKMADDDDKIPCVAGAVPDRAETTPGKAVSIDVLKNDKLCDGQFNPASLSVSVKPKAGSAALVAGTLVYTPGSAAFNGRDYFVYKVCTIGSNPTCYVASVVVNVSDPGKDCKQMMNDDDVTYRHLFTTDSLNIPVLANDQLCRGNRSLPVSIVKAPAKGVAYVSKMKPQLIIYKPSPNAEGTDNLIYQRCESGTCLQATVQIQAKAVDPACQLLARTNLRTASLSQDDDAKAGVIQIPVLLNDRICSPIAAMRITDNPSSLNLAIRSGVVYYTLSSVPKKGAYKFTYELIDAKNNRSTAQVAITLTD